MDQQFEQVLDKYAEVAVSLGVNIQPGQSLVIRAPIDAYDFVRRAVKHAYLQGARFVTVDWADDQVTLLRLLHAPDDALEDIVQAHVDAYEEMAQKGFAMLSVIAPDPNLLAAVPAHRIAVFQRARRAAMHKFNSYVQSDKISWSIVAVPSPEWATSVFPDVSVDEAVSRLWNYIFQATRVNQDDAVRAWQDHVQTLQAKAAELTNRQFKKLHYKAPGTDLVIELPEDHVWIGGGGETPEGTYFIANIPTEEVFTMPKKDGVNGVIRNTKPLSYGGQLIDNFELTFEQGRIVQVQAETGEDVLKTLIESDEGAQYLGEVALVPDGSPISQLNVIFQNTLFDENASNHLAIGSAYPLCIKGGAELNQEELAERGVNTSMVHVDFMVGSAEMDIDGELADGTRVPVFRQGNWAL
jgi:aminopeptidase